MLIYTLRASTIKFFGVVLLSIAVLISLVTIIPNNASTNGIEAAALDFTDAGTNEERIEFLNRLGYEVIEEPLEVEKIQIPSKFDSVYDEYNDMQKSQGLDLLKYRGRKVTRYTYQIENYDYDGRVIANLLVYKGKIIGGDICSLDGEGFIHGFERT